MSVSTPSRERSAATAPPTPGGHHHGSVATTLRPALERLFRGPVPMSIRTWDGSTLGPRTPTTIVLRSADAVRRMLWAPGEMGLSRAYVAGDLDVEGRMLDVIDLREGLSGAGSHAGPTDDVTPGLRWRDVPHLWRAARRLGVMGRPPAPPAEEVRLHGWRHRRARDAAAISHHYDVGNDFYRLVLGPSLTYSCAYWADGVATLEQAQEAKYELISRKLDLQPGMRLLDVGCGWGGMVLHAARNHGVTAVGITLSREQAQLARERVRDAGLDGQVEIRVQDYRDVADEPFDAVSSIGMFEHVGLARADEYFASLARLLRPGGRLLNHAISRPSPNGRPAIAPRSFMGRYVFPDAELIEVGNVVSSMQRHGLEVRDVESLREHYARTLHAWIANLESDWDAAQELVGSARARVWRLYMAGSAAGFTQNRLNVHQVLAVATPDSGSSHMPPTRTWLQQPLVS